ncbi:sugar porter family MFS transporter [Cellvibrio sp. pealriver]|uniref:sugar porter family MFS transporter n=1 Tax=Cellvibrio sp. pealriver TaxID=1622269 RepID=UPI00066FDF08|nr:sugar porter family MFS transporter [Cellvibrio sp. pealriver]
MTGPVSGQLNPATPAAASSWYPVLLALIVALGGFLLGFDGTVNSGAIPFYRVSLEIYDDAFLLGFSSGAIILGSIFGNLIAGYLGDWLGRKRALVITGVFFAIAALGTAFAHHIAIFIIAKIIAGIGVGIAILIAPVYIAEIAPAAQRGKLVSINQLNIVLGIFAAYFSNYFILQWVQNPELNWRWMLGVGFFPAAAYLLLLIVIPESPRWLMVRGREQEALLVLTRLRGASAAAEEIASIKHNLQQDLSNKTQRKSLRAEMAQLFSKPMRRILLIAFALAAFQQLSGINSVLYYAPMVFETSGVGRDSAFLQTIILGAVFVFTTLIAMVLIDKLGRKLLLIMGTAIMALSLGLASFSFYQARYQLEASSIADIRTELFHQGLVTEAANQNPDVYQKDRIEIAGDTVQFYQGDTLLMSLPLNAPDIATQQQKIDLLAQALQSIAGQTFGSEVEYFSAIKTALFNVVQLASQENNQTAYSATTDEQLQAKIRQDFSGYQSLLLKTAISINSLAVLIGLLGFIAGFSISLGPVTWTMLAEIFPNHLRAIGISTAGVLNASTSFAVASLFPWQLEVFGSTVTYLLYAIAMVLCFILAVRFIPETKGKTLEQLESSLVRGH